MAKNKKNEKRPSDEGEDSELESVFDKGELGRTAISSADQALLSRVTRFLTAIQTPPLAAKARREGYSAAEHREGWRLWTMAAGAERPLDHWFAERSTEAFLAGNERLALLQEIDTFENTWFPRIRAIIRRVVSRDGRDAFVAAFFQNLEQQPLGPGVIGSVTTLLRRVEDLKTSTQPDAKKVHAMLERRGLTEKKIKRIKECLAALQTETAQASGSPPVDVATVENAQRAQMEALADLRDWFNDWATTFRTSLNVHEQIRLGVTLPKRRLAASPADEESADVDGADVDAEDSLAATTADSDLD